MSEPKSGKEPAHWVWIGVGTATGGILVTCGAAALVGEGSIWGGVGFMVAGIAAFAYTIYRS